MNGQTEKQNHELSVKMRKELSVSGVKEVERFDEGCAVLDTVGGVMTVEGSNIRMEVLDTDRGFVSLRGRIDAVYYSADEIEERSGFLKRLFR